MSNRNKKGTLVGLKGLVRERKENKGLLWVLGCRAFGLRSFPRFREGRIFRRASGLRVS